MRIKKDVLHFEIRIPTKINKYRSCLNVPFDVGHKNLFTFIQFIFNVYFL